MRLISNLICSSLRSIYSKSKIDLQLQCKDSYYKTAHGRNGRAGQIFPRQATAPPGQTQRVKKHWRKRSIVRVKQPGRRRSHQRTDSKVQSKFVLARPGVSKGFPSGIISCSLFERLPACLELGYGVLWLSLCSLGLSANQPAVLFSHTKSTPATSYQLVSSTVFS